MPNHLQEKFQITVPNRVDEGEPWASFESARKSPGIENFVPKNSIDPDGRKFNLMPGNMDVCDQATTNMPFSMAGESDVSADTNPTSFAEGFKKREMKGTDDQYTGEHCDQFYGDAGGFVERNNYLDRE